MNRRSFLKSIALIPFAVKGTIINHPRYAWDKLSLYGVPYHVSDVSTGQWLGINRIGYINKEVTEMIQLLENDKRH